MNPMKPRAATYLVGAHRTDDTADLSVLFRLQVNGLALVVPAKIKQQMTHQTLSCPETEKVNNSKIDKDRILKVFG